MDDLDLLPILDEVRKAIKQTSIRKYLEFMAVLLKSSRLLDMRPWIHSTTPWLAYEKIMPIDFGGDLCSSLQKQRQQSRLCEQSWHFLSSIVGKILAWMILNCLISYVSEEFLPESQCGSRSGCSTIGMVFSLTLVWRNILRSIWTSMLSSSI